jgi:hypothetical protein
LYKYGVKLYHGSDVLSSGGAVQKLSLKWKHYKQFLLNALDKLSRESQKTLAITAPGLYYSEILIGNLYQVDQLDDLNLFKPLPEKLQGLARSVRLQNSKTKTYCVLLSVKKCIISVPL